MNRSVYYDLLIVNNFYMSNSSLDSKIVNAPKGLIHQAVEQYLKEDTNDIRLRSMIEASYESASDSRSFQRQVWLSDEINSLFKIDFSGNEDKRREVIDLLVERAMGKPKEY